MPHDTTLIHKETVRAHATRLKRPLRWTKIRRRALVLKLDGLEPDQVRALMGDSNCPYYLAQAGVDELLAELAVTRQGSTLIPLDGAEPQHELAAIQSEAQALGQEVTVQDLSKIQAGDSNKLALAQAGVLIGHPAYGYKQDGTQVVSVAGEPRTVVLIVLDPHEGAIVVYLFEMYIDGWTFPQIAADLNAQGYRTRAGRPWTADTLRDMLRNPNYAGFVLYRGTEDRNNRDAGTLYPGLHPVLIPWETFCQAQDARVQRHPQKPQARWICPWQNAPAR